jgi:colanic acid/amylovoran biosynthesis glycosyltransferase
LNKGPYDVIHCHFGQNGSTAVLLRAIGALSGKIVTTFHGFDLTSHINRYGRETYRNLFEEGDLFLPISERWKNRLIQLGCNENKILVHRMGINIKNLGEIVRQDRKNGSTIILSVARLVEKKGIDYGIKAVAMLKDEFRELQYIIIGDGIMRNELQGLIEKHQMQKNVKLLGWMVQDEVFKIMRKTNVFLAPSVTSRTGSQEGIPVVLMEAMAHRLPVVATRHSGIPEIVIDGQNGFLADERDITGMADKIQYLIKNPEVSIRMGEEGRKLIESSYDIEKLNKKLIQIFSEGCNQSQN